MVFCFFILKQMKLSTIIGEAEKKYLFLVEAFFSENWGATKLRSHDLSHHRRVWENARELLSYEKNLACNNSFIEKLLISCYLHDLGMAIDPGTRHGYDSRKLCEQFLSENKLDISDNSDVLEAIENHDNKDYRNSPVSNKLLLMLTVADDLDAFGYIGIYRYMEIYLVRGIEPEKMVQMVLENAKERFTNFEISFDSYPVLVEKHRLRYQILQNYFLKLESEFDSLQIKS
jgi:HD superfamily phosphodiesterase